MSSKRKPSQSSNLYAYCVTDKQKLPIRNSSVVKTKNNKLRVIGNCPNGHNVSRFISANEAQGSGLIGSLLGFPGGKIPILGDITQNIPLVGSLI